MSTDDLTITEQLEHAQESAQQWRQAHDAQLAHTVAAQTRARQAERKAQLLQSKLDGTAMAQETVMGGLCNDALQLLGEWLRSAELRANENSFSIEWGKGRSLRQRTQELLSTPRHPK